MVEEQQMQVAGFLGELLFIRDDLLMNFALTRSIISTILRDCSDLTHLCLCFVHVVKVK